MMKKVQITGAILIAAFSGCAAWHAAGIAGAQTASVGNVTQRYEAVQKTDRVKNIKTNKKGTADLTENQYPVRKYDDQGIHYTLTYNGMLDEDGFDGMGWTIETFTQAYNEQGQPLYTDIVIPDEIDGIRVAGMWYGELFKDHKEIRSVHFGKNMVSVRENAFKGCTGLERVEFPEALVYIGSQAFSGCRNLEEVTLPEGLKEIDWGAFENCRKIRKIVIPESTDRIDGEVFQNCTSLEKVVFKSAWMKMYGGVFENTKWEKNCKKKGIPLISNKGMLISAGGLSGNAVIDGKKAVGGRKIQSVNRYAFVESRNLHTLTIQNIKRVEGLYTSRAIKKIVLKKIALLQGESIMDGSKTIVLDGIKKYIPENRVNSLVPHLKDNKGEVLFGSADNIQNLYIRRFHLSKGAIQYLHYCFTRETQGKSRKIMIHVPKKDLARYRRLSRCAVRKWK